jgi:hypothetical protein
MVVNRRCYTILGSKFSWNWTSFVHSAAPLLLCCMNHLFHLLTNPFILECIFNSCCNHIDTRKSRFDQYIIWSTKILRDYKCIVNNTCLYVYIFFLSYILFKKSLKISNGWSEVVNRRTGNTMTKRKKGQNDKQPSTKYYREN